MAEPACKVCGLQHSKGELVVVVGFKRGAPDARLTCQHPGYVGRKPV